MINLLSLTLNPVKNTANVNNNPFAPKNVEETQKLLVSLSEMMPASSFKALTSQIEAMSDLDAAKKVGKKLDLAA